MSENQEEEYITLDDVSARTGIKKGSLYYYLTNLGIETHKFPLSKHAYISIQDFGRIVEAKKSPWKIKQRQKDNTIPEGVWPLAS